MLSLLVVACGSDEAGEDADAGGSDSGVIDVQDSGEPDTGSANNNDLDASGEEDTGAEADMSGQEDAGGEDAGSGDSGMEDAGTSEGCASGFTRTVGVDGAIVACTGPADAVNQCDAQALCGAGWHMCTATEYRAQYAAMEPPAVDMSNLWLASCVRDGADPQAPSDGVCSECTSTATGGDVNLAFSCVNAVRISSESLYVGVRAGAACTFVGTEEAGNDAYWSVELASTQLGGAFCCAD